MTKSKWSATALLIATFVLGALTGGAVAGLADRGTGDGRRPRVGMVEHLTQELDLTVDQRDSIRAILEHHKETFRSMRMQIGDEIKAVLTPEQTERYEEMMTSYQQRGRHGMKNRQGPARRSP